MSWSHGPSRPHRTPRMRREAGFTLSEFLLVAVFVAGLLMIINVSVRDIRSETATSNCQSELRTLKLAVKEYQAQNEAYPTDKDLLVDGGLVNADDVRRWKLTGGDDTTSPDYEPVDAACG